MLRDEALLLLHARLQAIVLCPTWLPHHGPRHGPVHVLRHLASLHRRWWLTAHPWVVLLPRGLLVTMLPTMVLGRWPTLLGVWHPWLRWVASVLGLRVDVA